MKDSVLLPVCKWHHLQTIQNTKVPLSLMTPQSLAIIWACWQVLVLFAIGTCPSQLTQGLLRCMDSLQLYHLQGGVKALPWFWDISFSTVCFSCQTFIFQASKCPSWILSLFLVLYYNSQKAVLLRKVSEESFWIAETWLSPHWLLRLLSSSRGTLLHLLFADTPRKTPRIVPWLSGKRIR